MGFFDKYTIEDVPVVRQRKDTKDVLVDMIKLQLKIVKNGPQVAKTVIKDGVTTVRYVSSWYNRKTGYAIPKVAGVSLFPTTKSTGGGRGTRMSEDGYEEYLNEMLTSVSNGDFDDLLKDLDRRRSERDKALSNTRTATKKAKK
jgi:hypothetical protein